MTVKTKTLKYIEIAKGKYEKKGDMDMEIALDVVRSIDDLDAVILVTGDSDFVALRDGREIYLCWQYGEGSIRYWHEIEAGFPGRQLIDWE